MNGARDDQIGYIVDRPKFYLKEGVGQNMQFNFDTKICQPTLPYEKKWGGKIP